MQLGQLLATLLKYGVSSSSHWDPDSFDLFSGWVKITAAHSFFAFVFVKKEKKMKLISERVESFSN